MNRYCGISATRQKKFAEYECRLSKITAQINEQGMALAEKYGIAFLAENFKKKNGFLISRKQGDELGVRHQDYCGCVYSKVERLLRLRQ